MYMSPSNLLNHKLNNLFIATYFIIKHKTLSSSSSLIIQTHPNQQYTIKNIHHNSSTLNESCTPTAYTSLYIIHDPKICLCIPPSFTSSMIYDLFVWLSYLSILLLTWYWHNIVKIDAFKNSQFAKQRVSSYQHTQPTAQYIYFHPEEL